MKVPWYVPNEAIPRDLNINLVKDEIKTYSEMYDEWLKQCPNPLAVNLLVNRGHIRRLKKLKSLNLRNRFKLMYLYTLILLLILLL